MTRGPDTLTLHLSGDEAAGLREVLVSILGGSCESLSHQAEPDDAWRTERFAVTVWDVKRLIALGDQLGWTQDLPRSASFDVTAERSIFRRLAKEALQSGHETAADVIRNRSSYSDPDVVERTARIELAAGERLLAEVE